MDEKTMATEFAKIYKALESNCRDLIDTNVDLKKMADVQSSVIHHFNRHIDIFNANVDSMNALVNRVNKYVKRQNIAIIAGIGGFLYLCDRISRLEDSLKKE